MTRTERYLGLNRLQVRARGGRSGRRCHGVHCSRLLCEAKRHNLGTVVEPEASQGRGGSRRSGIRSRQGEASKGQGLCREEEGSILKRIDGRKANSRSIDLLSRCLPSRSAGGRAAGGRDFQRLPRSRQVDALFSRFHTGAK